MICPQVCTLSPTLATNVGFLFTRKPREKAASRTSLAAESLGMNGTEASVRAEQVTQGILAPSKETPGFSPGRRSFFQLHCGGDVRKFEPKARLKFEDLDKSIQKLRAIYKVHPEWFEVPTSKSTKGKNEVDYSL